MPINDPGESLYRRADGKRKTLKSVCAALIQESFLINVLKYTLLYVGL
jgi:hypothetical protein